LSGHDSGRTNGRASAIGSEGVCRNASGNGSTDKESGSGKDSGNGRKRWGSCLLS